MVNVLIWAGIALTLIGWLALAWQGAKRLAVKDELEKFPQRKQTLQLHRSYCWLTVMAGIVLLLIAMII